MLRSRFHLRISISHTGEETKDLAAGPIPGASCTKSGLMVCCGMADERAIGVFDSGLGGLSVLAAIHRFLPQESTVYLGDNARLPYGSKSPATISRYALNNARALCAVTPLKLIVVACNTVSAIALKILREACQIPVIGVIEPSVQSALAGPESQAIAVLATASTIKSQAYEIELKKQGFRGQIHVKACPLFVPFVEEGMVDGPIAKLAAHHYLSELPADVDALILGCTHYPMLLPLLQDLCPKKRWIDCGSSVAKGVKTLLDQNRCNAAPENRPFHRYLVTDTPSHFHELFEFFLGKPIPQAIELIDLETYANGKI